MSTEEQNPPDRQAAEMEAAMQAFETPPVDPEQVADSRRAGETHLYKGTVVGVGAEDIFVDLGPRMQGVVSMDQFGEPPEVGQVFEFSLHGRKDDLWILSRKDAMVLASWEEIEPGKIVKARVSGQNTGGLELKIGPIAAFMPASHVDLRHIEDLSTFFGKTLVCQVMEVNRRKKRVLLSRRAVLAREKEQKTREVVENLAVGQIVRGTVSRLEGFGAFVEIAPGVEGLLHVSNISRQRISNPAAVLKVGQEIEAQVLEIAKGGQRIGLGMKQLEANPWDGLDERLQPGMVIKGKVTRLMDFGAFVEIEPGVEGLVHVSQLSADRVLRVSDAIAAGAEVPVRVVSIEPERERLSLSRLDDRGALIGSDDAIDSKDIEDMLSAGRGHARGTNLGALFRKALEGKDRGE